jgi:GT2 family glycosyltransferase
MRVLAHVITFNDDDVIDQMLDGLQRQTRRADEILIVDNASTDSTLSRVFPENVKVIRNSENQGPSGAVRRSFTYALEHGFDWVWVLDADSVPEPAALENLLTFFAALPPAKQEQVCFLCSWPLTETGGMKEEPIIIERSAPHRLTPVPAQDFTVCDCIIWSGSLFHMPAVKAIGLPAADYVADIGETEYGYRARQHGFISYMVHNSVVRHDVGRNAGIVVLKTFRIGRWTFPLLELSPWRAYYASRNPLYFWLYQCRPRRPRQVSRAIAQGLLMLVGVLLRPISRRRQLTATLLGLWHGLTAQMGRRY